MKQGNSDYDTFPSRALQVALSHSYSTPEIIPLKIPIPMPAMVIPVRLLLVKGHRTGWA